MPFPAALTIIPEGNTHFSWMHASTLLASLYVADGMLVRFSPKLTSQPKRPDRSITYSKQLAYKSRRLATLMT
ncbi:hypothetical protein PROAA_80003 [Candidatus Propionivibrio aalborgensis]|uniref:Uncharacterized protein n=1 Tax=Candidatus Propionivibrio aalborgensis TaxID=1860101 RepID=A0A1A8Y1R4_9RHOO|nr:hypothetical protein PROAA_80003 [Candidatus Propionivibrio aalborgensis]